MALVVNPSDERYASLVGATALTPVFRVPVPIVAHELADPEKGTGAAQICTFGDVTDVVWWRDLGLPARVIVRRDGTLIAAGRFGEPGWESRDPEARERRDGRARRAGARSRPAGSSSRCCAMAAGSWASRSPSARR